MRFSIKRLSTYITTIFGLLFIYLFVNFSNFRIRYSDYMIHYSLTKENFKQNDDITRNSIHYTNYEFSLMEEFSKMHDPATFKKNGLSERCGVFFDFFDKKDKDWKLRTFDDATFDKNIVHKNLYFKDELNKLYKTKKNSADPHPDIVTRKENVTINNMFLKRVRETKITENLMADSTTLLRIYGQCFINGPNVGHNEELQETFNRYSRKMFPFFTNKLPVFEGINDEIIEKSFPNMQNGYNGENYEFDGKNVVDFIKRSSNGKGIVISASSSHVKDLVKLIQLLRAMNNEFPIQIVYKGDLNNRAKSNIINAATGEFKDIIDPKNKASSHPESIEALILNNTEKYGSKFPKQDLWFVNIRETIKRNYKYSFPGYTNKILALLFTSFKEVILMDADTIPLVPLQDFFETQEYKETSTMFFKDRSLRDLNDYLETNYFTKLCPTSVNSMDSLFDVKPITNHTLLNPYMTGYRHYQEAGVVMIDKSKHFLGILMMFPLAVWKEPVRSSIWGEKEMYWLGMSIAGDENYQFNKYSAASIGEIVTNPKHKHYPDSDASEICSSHPGHVDKYGRLLWINSGFKYCKKNTHFRDRNKFPFETFLVEEIANLYDSPLKIKHGIVPPDLPILRRPGSPFELRNENLIKDDWKERTKDMDELSDEESIKHKQKEKVNPQKGWNKNSICSSYQYCAYDIIDSHPHNDGLVEKGHKFVFDDELVSEYDYLGSIWINGRTKSLV